MVKMDTTLWRLFRKSTAVGLVLLLTMIGLSPVAEAGTWIRRDWSKVQRVPPGSRTRVRLYKDRALAGLRKIEGRFKSATAEAITLSLPGGNPLHSAKARRDQGVGFSPPFKTVPWVDHPCSFDRRVDPHSCQLRLGSRTVGEMASQWPLHRRAHTHCFLSFPEMGRCLQRATQTPR